jgi:hypothetical protein
VKSGFVIYSKSVAVCGEPEVTIKMPAGLRGGHPFLLVLQNRLRQEPLHTGGPVMMVVPECAGRCHKTIV